MAALQVEGGDTAQNNDGLDGLRDELRNKNLLQIVDIITEIDEDVTLSALIELRKKDILELIDEINKDDSNQHNIPVLKKNKFAKIISKFAEKQEIAAPNDENSDPTKHIICDKDERDAIIKVSNRIKQIGAALIAISKTVKSVDNTVKQCESEINVIFEAQINKLKEREKYLINELYKIADDKKNILSKQTNDLKNKLVKSEEIHKNVNMMIKKAMSLDEIDKRKEIIIKQCNQEINDEFNPNPNIHSNIKLIADTKFIENVINKFGQISSISVPVLLNLMNNGENGDILIKWNIMRFNKNKNEKIKIEWIKLEKEENENDDDEKKEENEEDEEKQKWNEKTIELNNNMNETKVNVTDIGKYKFVLSYNNGINNDYSPKSNIKLISIVSALKDLIINEGETKILESDIMHKYNKIIIKSNGNLTTTAWNGNNGGKLILNAIKIIIKSHAKIQVNGQGFKGGKAKKKESDGTAFQGESFNAPSTMNTNANYGGGGGGIGSGSYGSTGGGGGGYGTKGNDAEPNRYQSGNRYSGKGGNNRYQSGNNPGGKGGNIYGAPKLAKLYLGSGGGSGHPFNSGGDGKCGGNGGGIISVTARQIVIEQNGLISSNGEDAPSVNNALYVSGGGGGSGGSIYIKCHQIENDGNIFAMGGKGAQKGDESGSTGICSNGGDGGYGRIRIDCSNLNKKGNIVPKIGYTENY